MPTRLLLISLLAGAACGHKPEASAAAHAAENAPARGVVVADAPPTSDPKAVVATVAGAPVTLGELDDSIKQDLAKLRLEHEKALYKARSEALDNLILKRLVDAETAKRGIDQEAFFKQEVEDKVPPATEAEAKDFYDKNPDKVQGQPLDALKPRILAYLTSQKRQAAANKLFDALKAKGKVQVLLAEPEEPRVTVAATGPSKGPASAPVTMIEFSDFQ